MTNFEIAAYIDHTLLKPTATWQQIEALCDEAIRYKTASVCIPPNYIARVKEKYGDDLKIATVIGFPLGYETTAAKAEETATALDDGADEIDMVINITDVKNSDYDLVREEIASLKAICADKILKVIVETCYLTKEEKINMCKIITIIKLILIACNICSIPCITTKDRSVKACITCLLYKVWNRIIVVWINDNLCTLLNCF